MNCPWFHITDFSSDFLEHKCCTFQRFQPKYDLYQLIYVILNISFKNDNDYLLIRNLNPRVFVIPSPIQCQDFGVFS